MSETMLDVAARPRGTDLGTLCREVVRGVDRADAVVVVRTTGGAAPLVAQAIDDAALTAVLGTVAGNNTLLVATRSPRDAVRVVDLVQDLSAGRPGRRPTDHGPLANPVRQRATAPGAPSGTRWVTADERRADS